MAIGERIKQLRRSLDLTQKEFAERLAIKPNTIATYELGRSNPIDAVIALICREFNVSKAWLRDGVGEMFLPEPTDELGELVRKYGLTDRDRVMIEKFLSFRQEEREIMIRYVEEVAEALSRLNSDRPESGNDWQRDPAFNYRDCPYAAAGGKRPGWTGSTGSIWGDFTEHGNGWTGEYPCQAARANTAPEDAMPGSWPDDEGKFPCFRVRKQRYPLGGTEVITVEPKNVHDFTPEEAHAALAEEIERRKREKAGLPDSGSGNSGEDAG